MTKLNKISKILHPHNLLPNKYFTIHNFCAYTEVVSSNTGEVFLVSIPQKYKIKIDESFKLKYIEIGEEDEINYVKNDNFDLESTYTEVDLDTCSLKDDNSSMVGHLEEAYKHSILLKDMNKEDGKDVDEIQRQLKRLRFCVQNIPFKLAIYSKKYLCIVSPDNTVQCYMIKNYSNLSNRKLYIVADIEILFKNIKESENHIRNIRSSLYKILDKTQTFQVSNLNNIFTQKQNISTYIVDIKAKRLSLISTMEKLKTMLKKLSESEKQNIDKLNSIISNRNSSYNEINKDLAISHAKRKIEEELNSIRQVKQDVIRNLIKVKDKYEDLYLTMDKLWFDNIVMLDRVINNIKEINNMLSNNNY